GGRTLLSGRAVCGATLLVNPRPPRGGGVLAASARCRATGLHFSRPLRRSPSWTVHHTPWPSRGQHSLSGTRSPESPCRVPGDRAWNAGAGTPRDATGRGGKVRELWGRCRRV